MLTLGIRYLTGCVVAAAVDDRSRVEWPPHPGRVFMALAAAHFQTDETPAERAALEWLEQQKPPEIRASPYTERTSITQFVPVNDAAGPATAPLQSAPGFSRKRQPRQFATACLDDDTVFFYWPDADPEVHFTSLENLCRKVTRIGHSLSLVQMWASKEAPEAPTDWVPDETRAVEHFRIPSSGSLYYLERQFNRRDVDTYFELTAAAADGSDKRRQTEAKLAIRQKFLGQAPPRLRPELSITQGYARMEDSRISEAQGTVFDSRLLVFALHREDGPYRHLDLSATLQITARFRESLLSHLGEDIPEVLSGHCGSGRSERPHISILPLAFVGREHAHGGILGVAVAVPLEIEEVERRRLVAALARIRQEGLRLGALGKWSLEATGGAAWRDTLRDRLWTGYPDGARQWATVTPYVFDRHPKAKERAEYETESADSVRQSWERVRRLPDVSVEVAISPISAHLGAPAAHQFPRLERKDGSKYQHTHAILMFSEPVVGPVVLGAGRYRGYGLCRPLSESTR